MFVCFLSVEKQVNKLNLGKNMQHADAQLWQMVFKLIH